MSSPPRSRILTSSLRDSVRPTIKSMGTRQYACVEAASNEHGRTFEITKSLEHSILIMRVDSHNLVR